MITYMTVKEEILDEEDNIHNTYGIRVVEDGREISVIYDISTDGERIQKLTDLCNENALDPIHLSDVVNDLLNEE